MNDNNEILIFIHVPKCAGSTVRNALLQISGNDFPFRWGHQNEDVKRFVRGEWKTKKFAYGHIRDRHIRQIEEAGIPAKYVTFIRNPVDRLISAYRYNASPAAPVFPQFPKQFPTFESWVKEFPGNTIMDFLAGEVETVEEYLTRIEERFFFVGTAENYEQDIRRLFRMLGRKYKPIKSANVTKANQYNRVEVSNELRAELEKRNALDLQIWKHFAHAPAHIHPGN